MIDLINISLQFGGKYLFRNVSYKINSGDKVSLVGANGTGKSSLLKILSGELNPESGKIIRQKGTSIGYLPQENVAHRGNTLYHEAASALTDINQLQLKEKKIINALEEKNITAEQRDDLIHRLGEVHHRLEESGLYTAKSKVEKILIGLGFGESDFYRLTDEFSGGWQMRIALAKILLAQNDLLLLDEPTNHLDIDSLQWLIDFLNGFDGALIIVSHDKHFVNAVTDKTLEIFLNKFYSFNGKYDAFLKYKEERDQQAEHLFALQQKKIKETERFIERFRYKATKARQVQSRIKQLEKIPLVELPEQSSDISIKFPEPPRSGRVNIELKNIRKAYGGLRVLNELNFSIDRGDKIAFVGPNGAGKTTLAKIISGQLSVDSGERIVGHNTMIAYYAQDVADELEPDKDILETLEPFAEDRTIGQLRALLGTFLFSGDDVFKKVGVLSGGEKSRVALAKILLTKSNLLVLDEPTNHLDASSKAVLQKALIDFTGSLVLVSHDIDFLRPIINKVADIREGRLTIYSGEIDYYLAKRTEKLSTPVNINSDTEKSRETLSRKDQKKFEARMRQNKYDATKDLIKKIEEVENKIETLELRQGELEALFSAGKIFSDPIKARELDLEYKTLKTKLEAYISEWETLSRNLFKIEKEFD